MDGPARLSGWRVADVEAMRSGSSLTEDNDLAPTRSLWDACDLTEVWFTLT